MTRILPKKCDKALLLQSKGIVHYDLFEMALTRTELLIRHNPDAKL